MSHEFDGIDATEKAGIEGALNRCRTLAAQIASELHNKRPERFVDKLSLADFYASLEHAADVLLNTVEDADIIATADDGAGCRIRNSAQQSRAMTDHSIALKYNPHLRTNIGCKEAPAVRVYRPDPEGVTLQIRREREFMSAWLPFADALAVADAISQAAKEGAIEEHCAHARHRHRDDRKHPAREAACKGDRTPAR